MSCHHRPLYSKWLLWLCAAGTIGQLFRLINRLWKWWSKDVKRHLENNDENTPMFVIFVFINSNRITSRSTCWKMELQLKCMDRYRYRTFSLLCFRKWLKNFLQFNLWKNFDKRNAKMPIFKDKGESFFHFIDNQNWEKI